MVSLQDYTGEWSWTIHAIGSTGNVTLLLLNKNTLLGASSSSIQTREWSLCLSTLSISGCTLLFNLLKHSSSVLHKKKQTTKPVRHVILFCPVGARRSDGSPFSQLILHETDKSKVMRTDNMYVFDGKFQKIARKKQQGGKQISFYDRVNKTPEAHSGVRPSMAQKERGRNFGAKP